MTGIVERGRGAALRNNVVSKSCKSMTRLSYRRSGFFESRNSNGSRMLCGIGAVLGGARQVNVVLFQKRLSIIYLTESVYFLVLTAFRFGRPRFPPGLLMWSLCREEKIG